MRPADAAKTNWITAPNEEITVSETHSGTMPGVSFTLDLVPVSPPVATFQMGVSGNRTFTVIAHFSGTAGEKCQAKVSGSTGGNVTKTIRQPPSSTYDQTVFTFEVEP